MPYQRAEYEIRIYYTVTGLQHIMRLAVVPAAAPIPAQDFADINLLNYNTDIMPLDVFVDETVIVMKPLYGGADDIERAELWKNDLESDGSTFISAYDISEAGTGGAGNLSQQVIFTMRTRFGGLVKVFLMEPNTTGSARLRPPFSAGTLKDFMDWICNADTWVAGRGDHYPAFPLGILSGQNEAIWRKRYRP